MIEFQSEEIERLQAEVARKLGYQLVDHRLELYAVPLDDNKTVAAAWCAPSFVAVIVITMTRC